MLQGLTLRNFRAFKNQSFRFSKINIFVGPNNSGKSSAISAINLLSQTVNSTEIDQSPLVLNGAFDSLGTFLDLVYGNRSNTPLGFDVSFGDFTVKADYKYRQQRREIELVRYELFDGSKQVFSYVSRKDAYDVRLFGQEIDKIAPGLRKRRPIFRGLVPSPVIVSAFRYERDVPQGSTEVRNRLARAERSIIRARSTMRRLFDEFDSLSPFRDKPQRTYLYSGETAQRIGTTGGNLATILSTDTSRRGGESRNMTAEISRWFKVTGIAEKVDIKSISPRHFEMVLLDKNGFEHNICDVGFGCSQVLPVLAASLNLFGGPEMLQRRQPMLIVQEPEIHLHPNAQASLGSFFAGLVPEEGQLFIETHSDNLVLRLARHVADGTLASSDVKIFYVKKQSGSSEVTEIEIDENGLFKSEWPEGFFPQRQAESLSLAQASFRSRQRPTESQLEFRYPEEVE
jgi:predicted ATPase